MLLKETNFSKVKWIDCQAPTKEKLIELAPVIGVPKGMLLSCLDPDFLPHLDHYNDVRFLMLRICEPKASRRSDTIQELTTKIAIFIKGDTIYSFHRLPLDGLKNIEQKIVEKSKTLNSEEISLQYFLSLLFEMVALSYDKPLLDLVSETDIFEEKILSAKKSKNLLKDGFIIKRKASAYKKVVKFTSEILNKLVINLHFDSNQYGYIKEKLDRYQFYGEDAFENIQGLLNLHIAIESQKTNEASFRTNEIVRVLTVATIFFLPLNFIAGIYGMNFEHLPLSKHVDGFWISLSFMALICIGLLTYVVKKGWMVPPPKD